MRGHEGAGKSHRTKHSAVFVVLAIVVGLALVGVALELTTGCFSFDDLCWVEDGDEICDPDAPLAGREVVPNWLAEPGDVTICPYSGHKFVVREDSSSVFYEGWWFVFSCSGACIEEVEADPGEYLDELVRRAGGPASDPDPRGGGAIDD